MERMLCHCGTCKSNFIHYKDDIKEQLTSTCPICHAKQSVVVVSKDMLFNAYVNAWITYMKDPIKKNSKEKAKGLEIWIDFMISNEKNQYKLITGQIVSWLDKIYRRKIRYLETYHLLKLLNSVLDRIIGEKGVNPDYNIDQFNKENIRFEIITD